MSPPAAARGANADQSALYDVSKSDRRHRNEDRRWSIEGQRPLEKTTKSDEAPLGGPGSLSLMAPAVSTDSAVEEGDDTLLPPDSNAVLSNEAGIDIDSDSIIRILKRPPNLRSEEDVTCLRKLTSSVKFFTSMNDPSLHFELCRHIHLEQVPDGGTHTLPG